MFAFICSFAHSSICQPSEDPLLGRALCRARVPAALGAQQGDRQLNTHLHRGGRRVVRGVVSSHRFGEVTWMLTLKTNTWIC